MEKLIVTAAVTGSLTVPTQTPYLAVTPKQIIEEAVQVWNAGASVVHVHARNPENGVPTPNLEIFEEIVSGIKSRTDLVICTTTGGAPGMSREERIAVVPKFSPELASLNMGSMNFATFALAERLKDWKYDWEKPFLENTKDHVVHNSFADLEYFTSTMLRENTKPELEVYDISHLRNAAYLVKKGLLQKPIHMQFVMGVLGGIGNSVSELTYMKQMADQLFGSDYTWSIIGVGYPTAFQLAAVAMVMGGHVRIGMEDNVRITRQDLAKGNGPMVEKVADIARLMDREVASPSETRKMLGLKGKDAVKF